MSESVIWQQKNKYVALLKPLPHYQVAKHNGTKGNCIITPDNIGIYDEHRDYYHFKCVKDIYSGENVKPSFMGDFVRAFPMIFYLKDSFFDRAIDHHDREIKERFEVRIHSAKSPLEIRIAKLYYESAQINRLGIKESVLKLREQ